MNISTFKESYKGDTEKAKRDIIEHDLHKGDIFRWSCRNGHIELAKWLAEKYNVDVHACDEYAFRWTCENGHIELARWLVAEYNVDVHVCSEYAFRWALINKRAQIIDMFLNELDDNEFKYVVCDKTAYIINHGPIYGWGSTIVFGIPIVYRGCLDESVVMAIIRPPKSARSY